MAENKFGFAFLRWPKPLEAVTANYNDKNWEWQLLVQLTHNSRLMMVKYEAYDDNGPKIT